MARKPQEARTEVTSERDVVTTGMASINQLAQMFETDPKTLPKKLKSLIPQARRGTLRLYNIREAASMIVDPGYDIEEWIKQASPQEVHPHLLKEFWNGQNARTKHEREMGDLWPTAQVVEAFADVFATIRMTLLLYADDVDREESLSDKQRQIIRRLTDNLIVRVGDEIQEKFKDYDSGEQTETDDEAEEDWNITAEDDDEDLPEAEADEEEDIDI